MDNERSEVWNLILSVALVIAGALVGYLYAASAAGPADNAAFIAQMAGNPTALAVCSAKMKNAQLETAVLKSRIETINKVIALQKEEQERYATVLMEEDNGGGQLILGGLALLLGVPTGVANIAQALQGAQPRWILPGKLQPRSPKDKAMYLYLDTKTGAREGPFTAAVLTASAPPQP